MFFIYVLICAQKKLLQPVEETEEEKKFRAIYQQIAGEVSEQREWRPKCSERFILADV